MSTQVNIRIQLNTDDYQAAMKLGKESAELTKLLWNALTSEFAVSPDFQGKFAVTVHGPEVVSLF